MRRNKFFPFGEVEVRISNVELPTLLTSRYCFTLCILDDDRNPIYRKEVVVHCVLEDATTDENFQHRHLLSFHLYLIKSLFPSSSF